MQNIKNRNRMFNGIRTLAVHEGILAVPEWGRRLGPVLTPVGRVFEQIR
jgi:hypothetical protein